MARAEVKVVFTLYRQVRALARFDYPGINLVRRRRRELTPEL